MFTLIAGVCGTRNLPDGFIGGIGKENKMPWYLKKDLEYFKKLTMGNIVVMGGNTYKSIGHALPGRTNVVLSRTLKPNDAKVFKTYKSLDSYLVDQHSKGQKIFIMGGQSIYEHFIKLKDCEAIYLTEIYKQYVCDTYFPEIDSKYSLVYASEEFKDEKENTRFRFLKYIRSEGSNRDEREYLKLGKHILNVGHHKKNRTDVDTISTFSYQMRFNISAGVPLLTTKSVPWKVCIEELLWFLRGETDAKILQEKNIKIWDGNTSRKFLDDMGFYEVPTGELRKGYGHQIRRYGEKGVDQLAYVENLLKTNPDSRRILWNLWNASDLDEMVLTPCFLGDNYVITKNGYRTVQDVTANDYLLTHSGAYRKCLNIQEKIYDDLVYTIKTKENPIDIKCTKEHLFYVCERENKNVKKWVEAQNLLPDKHVICMPINKESKHYRKLEEIESEKGGNIWYILGSLYGKDYRFLKDNRIKVTLSQKTINFLYPYLDIYKLVKKCDCSDICDHLQKLIITDASLYSLLYTLKNNNEFIQRLPKSDISAFTMGYITSRNDYIITDRLEILFLQRLYAKINMKIFFTEIENGWKISNLEEKKDNDEDWLYYPIKNIFTKKEKDVKVYNFETDIDHTYVVSNAVVHNCHNQVQFYVKNKKYLSAQLYCRSSDYFLGLPFNIFSYTVLVYILAKRCDLIPDELVVTLGDAHIYQNHLDQTKEMLNRNTRALPFLILDDSTASKSYEEISIEDFRIAGYFPQKTIKADMAV